MASLLVPLLYVLIVFGGLWVFSSIYRRRTLNKVVEPYFPRHKERDIYVSLLQKTNPPTPDNLLKAALVRRAMTDVQRIIRLREDKPALQGLLQKGSIGDDLWNSLLAAEKELEAEIMETAAEANTFVEGWGQLIFQTATEMIHNEKMRGQLEQLGQQRLEKEQKYGHKSKKFLPGTPLPPAAVLASPTPPSAGPSISSVPSSPAPETPSSPSAGAESVISSDGEGSTSPKSPKSAKKTKKRK